LGGVVPEMDFGEPDALRERERPEERVGDAAPALAISGQVLERLGDRLEAGEGCGPLRIAGDGGDLLRGADSRRNDAVLEKAGQYEEAECEKPQASDPNPDAGTTRQFGDQGLVGQNQVLSELGG
jgi:hypothetical protein